MIQSILKHKNQFWLLVAMLVAFALRVYALGAQSLWNDEGNGQVRIGRTMPRLPSRLIRP